MRPPSQVLITGGAGFIGTNLADRLATKGSSVTVYDNFSRSGVEQNWAWLRAKHGSKIRVEIADVCDSERLESAVANADQIFHLAAQVAVTTSLADPRHDFEVNAGGTLNLLEAIRARKNPPPLVFTSTNKVYGALTDLELKRNCTRYQPTGGDSLACVSERRPLEFHSPYGCSKGAADQYVLDYARTYNLPAVVFRMSCIYGPHQCGTEDQGWVAHFLMKALNDETINICGDGFQVRDILFVDDLVNALLLAAQHARTLSGAAFNIGGGPPNAVSLRELLDLIAALQNQRVNVQMHDWRIGDQRYYVSDTRKFRAATGWAPEVSVHDGVTRLYDWLREKRSTSMHSMSGGADAVLAH